MTPKEYRAEALARVRQVGINARRAGGAPKGKRNGKAIQIGRSRVYSEGEKAVMGVRIPGDF